MLRSRKAAVPLVTVLIVLAILLADWPGRGHRSHNAVVVGTPKSPTRLDKLHDVPSPVGTFKALLASTLSEQYTETHRYAPPGKQQPEQAGKLYTCLCEPFLAEGMHITSATLAPLHFVSRTHTLLPLIHYDNIGIWKQTHIL